MNTYTLTVDNLRADRAPLHHIYPRQSGPQSAHIEIDEEGIVTADWNGEIGGGVPMPVWHNRTLRVGVDPRVLGDALADYLESADGAALLERVVGGHSVEWDGNNHVGRLTDDATLALGELERALSEIELAEIWDADTYLFTNSSLADHWPVGRSLAEVVAALEAEADAVGIVIDGGSDAIRDALIAEAQRQYDDCDAEKLPAEWLAVVELRNA